MGFFYFLEFFAQGPYFLIKAVGADAFLNLAVQSVSTETAVFLQVFDSVSRQTDNGGVGSNIFGDDSVGADFDVIADFYRAEDLRAGTDNDIVADGGMAFGRYFAVFIEDGGAAERDIVVKSDVVADFGGFADNDSHAVVYKKSFADSGSGMNFDAGEKTPDLRDNPRGEAKVAFPKVMRKAVDENRVQPGRQQNRFGSVAGGRIPGDDGINVL